MKLRVVFPLLVLTLSKKLRPSISISKRTVGRGEKLYLASNIAIRVRTTALSISALITYLRARGSIGGLFPTPRLWFASRVMTIEERVFGTITLDALPGPERLEVISSLLSAHMQRNRFHQAQGPVHGDLWAGNVLITKDNSPVVIDLDPNTMGWGHIWLDPLTLILHNPTDCNGGNYVIQKFFRGAFEDFCEYWFCQESSAASTHKASPDEVCARWIAEFSRWSGWSAADLRLRINNALE